MAMTRRQLLASGSLAAMGYALRGPASSALAALARPAPRATPSDYQPLPPFRLVESSTLSEDYFTCNEVIVDPGNDRVAPVVRSDGSLVHLVMSAGDLYLVQPGGSPTAYTNQKLDGFSGLVDITGAAGSGSVVYAGYLALDSTGAQLPYAVTIGADGTHSHITAIPWHADWQALSDISTSVDQTGRVWFTVAGMAADGSFVLMFYDPAANQQSITTLTNMGYGALQSAQISVGTTALGLQFSALMATEKGLVTSQGLVGGTSYTGFVRRPDGTVLAGLIDWRTPPIMSRAGFRAAPTLYLWNDDQHNAFVGQCQLDGILLAEPVQLLAPEQFPLSAGPVDVAEWFYDPVAERATVYLLTEAGVLYVQQVDFTAATPASVPIPIQHDVQALYLPSLGYTSQSSLTIATPSPLFEAPALSMLRRPSSTATWVNAPLHTASPTVYPITTYRTMLTALDAGGVPISDFPLEITPEFEVMAFRTTEALPLPAGKTTPVPTDSWGQLCIAAPATALHASALTVDYSDGSTAQTLHVAPDAELHGFLAGGGAMNQYGSLADALRSNAGDGNRLPRLPTDDASITAVSSAIAAAVQAGQRPTTAPGQSGAPTPFTISGLGTPTITYTPGQPRLTTGLGSWWDDVVDDAESVWHAIERGVATVGQVASGWDSTAQQWFVSLSISIGDWVDSEVKYLVNDLRTACVAIGGILSVLGADLAAALDMFRTLVSDTLTDAQAIADVLSPWLQPGGSVARAIDSAFDEASSLGHTAFRDSAAAIEETLALVDGDQTLFDASQQTLTDPGTGATHFMHNVKATWLLEKTRATSLPTAGGTGKSTDDLEKLLVSVELSPAWQKLPQLISTFTGDPNRSTQTLPVDWFTHALLEVEDIGLALLDSTWDQILQLFRDAIDDAFELFSFNLDDLPFIGDLLSYLGITDLTVNRLLCLNIGFGMAVAGDILFPNQTWWPGQTNAAPRSGPARVAETDWGQFIVVGSVVCNGVSAIPISIADKAYLSKTDVSTTIGAMNVFFGLAVNAFTFPFSTTAGGHLEWTPATLEDTSLLGTTHAPLILWLAGFGPTLLDAVGDRLKALQPTLQEPVDDAIATIDFFLGALLIASDVTLAVQADQGNVAIALAVLSWVYLMARPFRWGGPENDGFAVVSVAFDVLTPIAVMITNMVLIKE